jgi:hypothetical protein
LAFWCWVHRHIVQLLNQVMKNQKITGLLFILGAAGVLIPYIFLTIIFDYPSILREDIGVVLMKFNQGGNSLILTWWLFAILGLPLLIAYIKLGKQLEQQSSNASWLTTVGVIGLVTQMVGLLRWSFVVPILAHNYRVGNETSKEITKAIFEVIHQYGGVVLGEHVGQLFTIVWVIGITRVMQQLKLVPVWISGLGYGSSAIYLLAQAELFATVIPNIPVWDSAGFIGSTLWIIWLIGVGVILIRKK